MSSLNSLPGLGRRSETNKDVWEECYKAGFIFTVALKTDHNTPSNQTYKEIRHLFFFLLVGSRAESIHFMAESCELFQVIEANFFCDRLKCLGVCVQVPRIYTLSIGSTQCYGFSSGPCLWNVYGPFYINVKLPIRTNKHWAASVRLWVSL